MQDPSTPADPGSTRPPARRRWGCRPLRQDLARAQAQAERAAASEDELLQGLQGLVLQLQAIADGLPAHGSARDALERVMAHADALLARASQPRLGAQSDQVGLVGRWLRWWRSRP